MEDSCYFYVPRAYNRPAEDEIHEQLMFRDTERPEINSQQFTFEASRYSKPTTFLPFFCNLEHSDGLFILGSNNFTTFVFDGIVIGTPDFESIVQKRTEGCEFHIPETSTVCGLKILEGHLFLVATMDCRIQLWDPSIRNPENTQILKCGEKPTEGYVMHMDKLTNHEKFVLGSSKGSIYIYDYDLKDLMSLTHYPHAHSSEITGISASPGHAKLWASCSIDRTCALWDTSKERPALALLRDHETRLTSVHWTSEEENKGLVMVGDEIGNILTVDPRLPKKVLDKTRIANREITKICFGGPKNFGAVSKSNKLPIVHIEDCNELKIAHTHECSKMIYDMSWGDSGGKSFYVVGEQQYAEQVNLM